MPDPIQVQRTETVEHQDNVIHLDQEEEQQAPPENAIGLTGLITMRDRLNTLEKGGVGSKNSQKFDAVTNGINDVGRALANNELTGNQTADEETWELISGKYQALFTACEVYTDRWHVFTAKGKERQAQVKEILEKARTEYQCLSQWPTIMGEYAEQDRSQIKWKDIIDESKGYGAVVVGPRTYQLLERPDQNSTSLDYLNQSFEYNTNMALGSDDSIGGVPTSGYIQHKATGGEQKKLRLKKEFRSAFAAIDAYHRTMTTAGSYVLAPVREDFDSDADFDNATRQFQSEVNLIALAGEATQRLTQAMEAMKAAKFCMVGINRQGEEAAFSILDSFTEILSYQGQISRQISLLLDPVDTDQQKKGTMSGLLQDKLVNKYSLNTALLYQTHRDKDNPFDKPLVGYGNEWEEVQALQEKESPTEQESRGAYEPLARKQKNTMSKDQRSFINDYIIDSRGINAQMRGTSTYDQKTTQEYNSRIDAISKWLPKTETEFKTYRGVSDVALVPLLKSLAVMAPGITEHGLINHEFLEMNKSQLIGLEFTDQAFSSTTLVKEYAQKWAQGIPNRDRTTLTNVYLQNKYGAKALEMLIEEDPDYYEKKKDQPDALNKALQWYFDKLAKEDTPEEQEKMQAAKTAYQNSEIQSHLYEIQVPKGAKAGFIDFARKDAEGRDSNAGQGEVLLDQKTRYKIKDIVNQKDESGHDIPHKYKFILEIVLD